MRWLGIVWKAYLVLWIANRAFSLSERLVGTPSLLNSIYLALALFGFVPLLGFLLAKPILRPAVWRVWLLFALCWALFDLVYYAEWLARYPLVVQVLGTAVAVPSYLAVYIYSRPSNQVWAPRAAA